MYLSKWSFPWNGAIYGSIQLCSEEASGRLKTNLAAC